MFRSNVSRIVSKKSRRILNTAHSVIKQNFDFLLHKSLCAGFMCMIKVSTSYLNVKNQIQLHHHKKVEIQNRKNTIHVDAILASINDYGIN